MIRKTLRFFLLAVLCGTVFFASTPQLTEASATFGAPEEFGIEVGLNQGAQIVTATCSDGIPGAYAVINFDITYDQGNGTQTSSVTVLRILDGTGSADFSFPLSTVATVGNFLAVVTATYVHPLTNLPVTADSARFFAGVQVNDFSEVAGLNPTAYQSLVAFYAGGISGSAAPTAPANVQTAFTPGVAATWSVVNGVSLPQGQGTVFFSADGVSGILSGN